MLAGSIDEQLTGGLADGQRSRYHRQRDIALPIMLSLRAHIAITASLFVAIIALAMIGNALEASGAVSPEPGMKLAAIIAFGTLAAAFAFSAVPVIVKLVLGVQARTNPGRPFIAALIRRERTIVFALWAVMALGLALAVPAAIIDGAFD
jgi:hypothetical protein